jgi:integrase
MGRRATGTVEPLKGSIRLKFTVGGARCVERLDLAPTPANLKAAAAHLSKVAAAIAAGTYCREDFFEAREEDRVEGAHSGATTFSVWAEAWLATWVKAGSTKRTYKTAFDASWNPHFGQKKLRELRASHIKTAVATRAKELKPGTLNNHLSPLRECLRAAVEDKLILASPAAGVENLPRQRPEPDPLSGEERDLMLAHLHRKFPEQVWNYYTLAFHTGLRPSEQIAVRWGDVDWRTRKLRIQRARVDGEEKASTKTNRVRHIDLSDAALAALQRQKAHTFLKAHGYVFENPNTLRPWNNEAQQRIVYFAPTLKALGLRHRDAYQTRHTFATALIMAGVKPAYIARQLGHTTTALLFETYSKWLDDTDGGAEAKALNNALMTPSGSGLGEAAG